MAGKEERESFAEVIPGSVYTAQGCATSGEPIYFGLERISAENQEQWERYVDFTNKLTSTDDGILTIKIPRGKSIPEGDLGMSKEAFEDFRTKLKTRWQDKSFVNCLKGIAGGAVHCFIIANHYIAYVSKVPVTGLFSHPETKDQLSLKIYLESYQNLLMMVGSYDRKGDNRFPYYENRGIFRNPASLLGDESYKGISVKLHGFTAIFWEQYWKKKFMFVSPLEKMGDILFSCFKPGEEIFERPLPLELKGMEDSLPEGGLGAMERPCVITTKALKEKF